MSQPRRDLGLAALVGAIVAVTVGAGAALMLATAEREALPVLTETIESGSDTVGQAVAAQISKALGYGIPLSGLYGVETYFADVVAGVPTVDALALVDLQGATLAETRPDVSGISFPVASANGVAANVILAPAPPFFGRAVLHLRVALAATALLCGLIAACITFLVLTRGISAGRERLRTMMRSVADGVFPPRYVPTGRGITVAALSGLDHRLAPLEDSVRRLEDEVATVRAIDFDGSLAAKLGPILAPVEPVRSIADADAATGAQSRQRLFALWLTVVVLGIYATAVPFVANFAIDRQWAHVPPAWWPSVPWIGECMAAAIAFALARMIADAARPAAAVVGLLIAGLSFAADYWLREYDLFLESRMLAGAGLGVAVAALFSRRGGFDRAPILPIMLALAAAVAGPLLGGLLGEAIGRRMSFLTAGVFLIVLALVSLTVRWNTERYPSERRAATIGWRNPIAAAGVAFGAIALVLVPIGPGYENYLAGGLLVAAIGIVATFLPMTAPPMTGWPVALASALIGFGLLTYSSMTIADPIPALLTILGALFTGAGVGGLMRLGRARAGTVFMSLGVGCALGAASASVSASFALPPLAVAAGLVVVLTLAGLIERRVARRAA